MSRISPDAALSRAADYLDERIGEALDEAERFILRFGAPTDAEREAYLEARRAELARWRDAVMAEVERAARHDAASVKVH